MTLEPEDVPRFLVVIATILAALLLLAFIVPRVKWPFRPTAPEVGQRPTYTAWVGAVIGSTFLSEPFVRVSTYDNFVVVVVPFAGKPYVLRRSDGVRIEREEFRATILPVREVHVVLRHDVPKIPPLLRLISRDARKLETALHASLTVARS